MENSYKTPPYFSPPPTPRTRVGGTEDQEERSRPSRPFRTRTPPPDPRQKRTPHQPRKQKVLPGHPRHTPSFLDPRTRRTHSRPTTVHSDSPYTPPSLPPVYLEPKYPHPTGGWTRGRSPGLARTSTLLPVPRSTDLTNETHQNHPHPPYLSSGNTHSSSSLKSFREVSRGRTWFVEETRSTTPASPLGSLY